TPSADAVFSVLHRPVESASDCRHSPPVGVLTLAATKRPLAPILVRSWQMAIVRLHALKPYCSASQRGRGEYFLIDSA
ncbi:MAG: hypothetical protein V4738_14070, partial [Pseudomonadota bacterium]